MAKGQVKIIFNYFHCRISSDSRALTEEREVGGPGFDFWGWTKHSGS